MAKKSVKIEGVDLNLDALKLADHTEASLKKTEIFSHLPEAKQDVAYKALKAELDAHEAAPLTVTVEKGKAVKNFAAEAPAKADESSKVGKVK